MSAALFFWALARVAGLAAFASLSLSLLTGLALRTALLDRVGSNRSLRSVHEYTTLLWLPLGGLHVVALLLDATARIRLVDLLVPFGAPVSVYGLRGVVAIGLGTLTLELLGVVVVTGWLRRSLPGTAWRWIHRLSYAAFGMLFVHAVLGGSDFSDPGVSALTWAVAAALALLSLARLLLGRLPA